jgi:hypothetical protein
LSTKPKSFPTVCNEVTIQTRAYKSSLNHVTDSNSDTKVIQEGLQDTKVIPIPNEESHVILKQYAFLNINGLRGGEACKIACDNNLRHLKLVPMGTVGACIYRKSTSNLDGGEITSTELFPKLDGLTFCFLPLPVATGLPVHTNAYWEISSNRRDIWKGSDTTGSSTK